MNALVSMLLLAGPAVGTTWKGTWGHTNDLVATAVLNGKKQTKPARMSISLPFSTHIEAANDRRPTEVTVEIPKLEIGPFVLRDDGGTTTIVFKKGPPEDKDTPRLLRAYLGRLALEDPDREAMASCSSATAAATERWLKRNSAVLYSGDPSETKVDKVTSRCSSKKGRTQHDVSWDAVVGVGMTSYRFSAKGTVTVDPRLWVTTWNFGGPIHVESDNRVELKVAGTFHSTFDLTPNR